MTEHLQNEIHALKCYAEEASKQDPSNMTLGLLEKQMQTVNKLISEQHNNIQIIELAEYSEITIRQELITITIEWEEGKEPIVKGHDGPPITIVKGNVITLRVGRKLVG